MILSPGSPDCDDGLMESTRPVEIEEEAAHWKSDMSTTINHRDTILGTSRLKSSLGA